MKKVLVAIAAVSLLAACNSSDPNKLESGTVKIKGTIAGVDSGYLELLVPSREDNKVDSIKIENAKFEYKLDVKEPNLLVMRVAGTQGAELPFFVDPGTVTMTLNKDSMWTSKIDGGATQKLYKEMEDKGKSLMQRGQGMYQQYMQAQQVGDTGQMKRLEEQLIGLQNESKTMAVAFAKQHNNSVLSAYLGLVYLGQPGSEAELKSLYDTLKPAVKSSFFGKKIGEFVSASASTAIGSVAPDFQMNDVNGTPIALSSLKGKVVLVDFWASWCAPCREENPNVVAAFNKYKDKGFTILGVSLDKDKDAWVKAIGDDKLTWQHVSDLKYWDNAAAKLYKVQSIPANFLLDKEGKIIGKDLRGAALDAKLAEVLK